jgi:UDP-N-acetyl-D-glucosamine dehydrogenase
MTRRNRPAWLPAAAVMRRGRRTASQASRLAAAAGTRAGDWELLVIGLGYAGLPLAAEAGRCGLTVTGYDPSREVVTGLNHGRSHIADVPPADIRVMLAAGFRATADKAAVGSPGTIVICGPTPFAAHGGPTSPQSRQPRKWPPGC